MKETRDREERRMKETRYEKQQIEHTSPIWRVLGVALAFGAIAALGYYFQQIGYVDEFATVAVITAFFSVSFWARKRPDKLRRRFGPFGKIADAVRESGDDIQQFVHERPLRVGVALAACYGVAVVIAKSVLVAILSNIWAWPLAVAAGAGVGALVAAPEFFGGIMRRMSVPDDEENFEEDELPDEALEEDELARRRASGEE